MHIVTLSENKGAPRDSHRSWKLLSVVVEFQVPCDTGRMTDNENEVLANSGGMQVPRRTGQGKRFPQCTVV